MKRQTVWDHVPRHHRPYQWMFDGEVLTITEFAQRVYGDTPQRTEFLLKYSSSRDNLKQAR